MRTSGTLNIGTHRETIDTFTRVLGSIDNSLGELGKAFGIDF
jgi:hypothetical protein